MEEGVVNEILQGPFRDVFDSKQLITDVSGSGNNWWGQILLHKVFIQKCKQIRCWKQIFLSFVLNVLSGVDKHNNPDSYCCPEKYFKNINWPSWHNFICFPFQFCILLLTGVVYYYRHSSVSTAAAFLQIVI